MLARARMPIVIQNEGRVRSLSARRLRVVVACCSFAGGLLLAIGATPAGAVVAKIGGHGYGITPINAAAGANLAARYEVQHRAGLSSGRLAHRYDVGPSGGTPLFNAEGGPVMHRATTHVIYWDPDKEFTSTTKGIVDGFFGDVAHDSGLPTNVFAIAGQYTDTSGNAAYSSTFGGEKVDKDAYPTSGNCETPEGVFADPGPYSACLYDEQLQKELSTYITKEGLPKGPTQLYILLLPHKVVSCLEEEDPEIGEEACSNNVFCAYHSYIQPGTGSEIIYADIPFSLLDEQDAKGCQADGHGEIQLPNGDKGTSNTETRFADVALKYISHEYIEAATDPLVNFETAWVDVHGLEIGDKCNGIPFTPEEEGEPGFDKHAFTPTLGGSAGAGTLFNQAINTGHYYLQSEWDNAGKACLMTPLALISAGFVQATSATAGLPVGFHGSATDPYGAFVPTWTFGDGGTGTGASPSHTYAAAGEYTVTMTPKDALTDSTATAVSHTITVAAPAPPPPPPPVPVPVQTTTTTTSTSASTLTVAPTSAFPTAHATMNAKTGVLTFTTTVANPGTFSWLATFQNGKFGAFSSASKCKTGFIRLGGRCRPAKIVFAKGSKVVGAAGSVSVTLKPSASGRKALKNALKHKKGVPVTIVFSFKSSLGGSAVSHTQSVMVKLKK
jgi:hypothetical protein